MEASCWVTRKIFLSPASASSSARTDASRPTMNGVIICGKMTISRTGIIGTRLTSSFSRLNMGPQGVPGLLACLFQQAPVNFAALDHLPGDHEIAELALSRQVVHHFQHQIFQNHAQTARAHF